MVLSRTCMYGIRATLYLASTGPEHYLPVRSISERLGLSFHFLAKILQTLTQHGVMTSFRGPNGGVALARAPDQIRLIEVVEAIDGLRLLRECILGLSGCGEERPCPLHEQWAVSRESLRAMFANTTLQDLAEKTRYLHLRLEELGEFVGPEPDLDGSGS